MASQAEIEALAVAKEVAANQRAQEAGWSNAAAYERDANRRSIEAGFTSAVDQEIDANRRAREAGFKNAALQENPAAAAPGESIYSTAPFIDPRRSSGSMHAAGPAQVPMSRFPVSRSFYNPVQSNRWSPFSQGRSRIWGGFGGGYGSGFGSGYGSSYGSGFGGGYGNTYQPQSLFNFSQYNPYSRPSFGGGFSGGYGRPQYNPMYGGYGKPSYNSMYNWRR